jgi:hypothetical protein
MGLGALALAATATAAAGCGGEDGATAGGSCASGLKWHGVLYIARTAERVPTAGAALGDGVAPACYGPDDKDRPVTVVAIQGVPPALGVRVRGDVGNQDYVYLPVEPSGYFLSQRDHPLHSAFYPAGRHPYVSGAGRRCSVAGTVRRPGDVSMTVHDATGDVNVSVDAATRVSGYRRAGHAYLQAGDKVAIAGRRCRAADTRRWLTAVTITPPRA